MTPVVLIRHAEPLIAGEMPAAQWPLADKGRIDASVVGRHLASRFTTAIVWTSPERRARETAALAFPLAVTGVRDELSEVGKPWYASVDEHANAVASYLRGKSIEGWERREDVIARIAQLKVGFRSSLGDLVLVSHGVLLTTWLDHEIGLEDPFSFWCNLQMPDAWEVNLVERSLVRIV